MGIRIQPRLIDVPEKDPFTNDLLNRKEPAEVLTHLVGSIEGPCAVAVDTAWGNGKTTFLRLWAQYLRNEGFVVVKFNAWETDFSGDPLVALSTELTEGLRKCMDGEMATKINATEEKAKEVLRRAVPGLIRVATAGILDLAPLLEKEVGQALASYAENRLSGYQREQKSVRDFRRALEDMTEALSKEKGGPLIVMIDDLDRCRPSYAVELLEVAKHLFAVDGIVFVLAINRSELAHSIRALYGSAFDATGYLRRFFDVDFQLPESDRAAFIDALLKATQINDFLKRTQDREAKKYVGLFQDLLKGFFRSPDLSLRQIEQAIHRLGLVLSSLPSNKRSFVITAIVAMILRTIDPDLYHRFVGGEASDLDVSETVFGSTGARTLRRKNEGQVFEAMIIVAAREQKILESIPQESIHSPLLQQYRNLVSSDESDNASRDPERKHAARVTGIVDQLERTLADFKPSVGFREVVQRIELFSPSLIDLGGHPNRPTIEDPGH